ncbi:SAM-dependent methyltransferase [Sphingomicrobium astaxanthinifaciens]|uniref:SAM-dependent methyltransferase n=1 Tax=Sphingomicrobium astaxanthinifaciens TaxID=1227949 RepID=UPI001FCAA7A8|nr:cyclopropane-fatty-acyl-phospholipid synthase family protein [Sphingomicrobium astaxanthinifaciens]MCJ7421296.1 cyclopropane-fatty-acyl-phospholipid synthase family protein [Sphingomicrobium astaxanthinifaciens]
MSLLKKLADQHLTAGTITLIRHDGTRETIGSGRRALTVKLHDSKVIGDIVRNPRLRLGEAYMDGRLTIEDGSILDLLEIVQKSSRWEEGGLDSSPFATSALLGRAARWLRRNNPVTSRRNVAHHYDIGNDLYALFLDERRQYSCGYVTDEAHGLERIQADKLAHIAAKLYLREGDHVLDIGSGWGGLAIYLNKVAGVKVTGVTLSVEQLDYARKAAKEAGVEDQVRFELTDYRALTGSYDRIVSVGMFEHVGEAHYQEFYRTCRELLADDGVMLVHTIGNFGPASGPDPFTDKYIFPGYHIPSLSQMCAASEKARLITTDIETLRLHYTHTLRHWLERCEAAKDQIVALLDEKFYRMWCFYLAGGVVMFEDGGAGNYQAQYVKDRRALPITRDYMVEAEARYRAIDAG